ncbi:MAG: heparinase II/III family protein [Cyclobacteriaceae bacterium]|nr:heparinase II/III family protein [Cyclobacteriaceae bacterium]
MIRTVVTAILISIIVQVQAQHDWRGISTTEDFFRHYPEKALSIFQNLDFSRQGLSEVKQHYENQQLEAACKALLRYYIQHPSAAVFKKEIPQYTGQRIPAADSILSDIFTFQRVAGKVPRDENGNLIWSHQGPEHDIEWAWALNRHYPINYLYSHYVETGNPEYATYIDSFVKDWVIKSWPYPGVKSSTAMWRGLEVSFRVKLWADLFFGLAEKDLLSEATRLLILSSLPDHAHYARTFHAQNNWLTMEISGLATVAAFWPEFAEADEWLNYAKEVMVESMKDQVYPDGVQTELTSSYHYVSLHNFKLFYDICQKAGVELPEYYTRTMEDMWSYLAYTIRPDGFGLLNNDADRINNKRLIEKALESYDRPDWDFIVNHGKSGTTPETGPSVFYPWAGHLISRSGFDEDAHWSFFDMGPWGSGHQHNDKMHISISAYGRDLLVDGGRFAYRGAVAEKFRKYALGSESHNVLMIDGKGQAPGPTHAKKPTDPGDFQINPDFDYATASFDAFKDLEGDATHTRTFHYQRGGFWIVVDHITTDRPRTITALWHFHPENVVHSDGKKVFTQNHKGNLWVTPLDESDWKVEIVKGQEEPVIQGWYSEVYNKYEPNETAIYSVDIEGDATFVWLLYPSEKVIQEVSAQIIQMEEEQVKVNITSLDGKAQEISIPLNKPTTNLSNTKVDGYRGIWFELGQKYEHGDKYSGALGTYTSFHIPLAAYSEKANKTFFVYGGTKGSSDRYLLCMAGEFDHATGLLSKPTVVCDKNGVDDPHDNPTIMIDDNDYIWVFVSGRGRSRPGFKYKSVQPLSIDAFELISEEEMTYPQPWKTKDGYIHLFTKYTGIRQLYFETSTDGMVWTDDKLLAAIPQNKGERSGHYQVSAVFENQKVGTFFNRHPDGNVDKRTDLYYVETIDMGKTWTNAAGSPVTIPMIDLQNPAFIADYYSLGKNIYIRDMVFDDRGHPVCLFIRSNGHEPGPVSAPYEWCITRWNGKKWITRRITESDHNYDMGSLYLDTKTWKLVAPTGTQPQVWGVGGEIEIWQSKNSGKSWKKLKAITENSEYNHSYVRRPLNYTAPFSFFWADGHPHEFSPSRLYFGDLDGNVWQLPYDMNEDYQKPIKIK